MINSFAESSNHVAVDDLFNEIDRNIEQSRRTMQHLEDNMQLLSDDKWTALLNKALARENDECSICMNKYNTHNEVEYQYIYSVFFYFM